MSSSGNPSFRHFAFLAVAEMEAVGACGGMLLVNPIGRPVEFHCTTPLLPTRTQEILYGATLREYLFCEQIAVGLIRQARVTPGLVLVRQPALLALHGLVDLPLVLVAAAESGNRAEGGWPGTATVWKNERIALTLRLGNSDCLLVARREALQPAQSALEAFHAALPVDEPFERIQKAIEEAQAVARQPAGTP